MVQQAPKSRLAESVTLIVTNSIKLGGLAVAVHEAFFLPTTDVRPSVLAMAALMMAGAQSLESALTAFFKGK